MVGKGVCIEKPSKPIRKLISFIRVKNAVVSITVNYHKLRGGYVLGMCNVNWCKYEM